MSRIVSVWLPAWPIERMRRADRIAGKGDPWGSDSRDRPPFALVENGAGGLRLTAVNGAAWDAGLRPGRALADARAVLPALLTRAAQKERDRAALEGLAHWAGRYGPRRNVEVDDGLWIDVTGVAHLFGGEERLLEDLLARLRRVGITARVGLADTPAAAFALARFTTSESLAQRIAPPGEAKGALVTLPVEALRLPSECVVLLRRLGLRHIGQLYDLPREALAQRFRSGAAIRTGTGSAAKTGSRGGTRKREREAVLLAGTVLGRLDRALGFTSEPRVGLEEPPLHLVRRLFAEPLVSAEGVSAAMTQLAHDLGKLLEDRGEGGTRFALSLYRTDGSSHRVQIGASRACRSAGHLMGLLGERIATLDAGFGLDGMTLACTEVEALEAGQIALGEADAAASAADVAALLDRLSNRLGAARVVRLAPVASHIPERAEQRVPVLRKPVSGGQASASSGGRLLQILPRANAIRPPFLLPEPELIAVMAEVPEGPPLHFTWRRIVRRIQRSQGPERIEPEWWRAIGRSGFPAGPPVAAHLGRPRDYYMIEDTGGGRYWVFRAGLYGGEEEESPPVWFMHGVLA